MNVEPFGQLNAEMIRGSLKNQIILDTSDQLNTKNIDKNIRNSLSVLGLLMICMSFFFYDTQIKTPGLFSLLPTLGAALLIFANDDAVINRSLLSWKLMTFIGLISYSLYLWHWPLIAYLTIVMPKAPQWYYGVALLMSFTIAILVYSLIENPIRRMKSNTLIVYGLILALIACVGLGQFIKKAEGIPSRAIAEAMNFSNDFTYHDVVKEIKLYGVEVDVTNKNVEPTTLFIGDSHIQQYAPRVKVVTDKLGSSAAFLTSGGCLASIGINSSNSENCRELPTKIEKLASMPQFKTIVIGQMWGVYKKGHSDNFQKAIEQYIELLQKYGQGKKVFILLDAPWDYDSYDIKKRIENRLNLDVFNKTDFHVAYPQNEDWLKGNLYVADKMSPYATMIKTEHLVCPNKTCNLKNYKDADHLRSSYIKENAQWIDAILK